MLSSVFRYPMPLLLWHWSACRKKLLLYETLQYLWKQFNLVYTQRNVSPGITQNSPQTRLSSSLGFGLSLTIWDCSIKLLPGFYIQLPPLSRMFSLLMLLETNFYFMQIFLQQWLKFFFHKSSLLTTVNNCVYYYCFGIAACTCISLVLLPPPRCLPSPTLNHSNKAIHCYTVGLYKPNAPEGGGAYPGLTFSLMFRRVWPHFYWQILLQFGGHIKFLSIALDLV